MAAQMRKSDETNKKLLRELEKVREQQSQHMALAAGAPSPEEGTPGPPPAILDTSELPLVARKTTSKGTKGATLEMKKLAEALV